MAVRDPETFDDMFTALEQLDLDKDEDGLETKSDNGGASPNYPWTQALSQTGETVFPNEVDVTAFSVKTDMKDSLEKGNGKNPMLLCPVIRCVLKFLKIEDIKNCRLVCREWGSIGKYTLASRALIRFHKYEIPNRPVDFQSCFLDSTSNFSVFKISGFLSDENESSSWTIDELSKFFDAQQKYIKELTLRFRYPDENLVKKIAISSWISKSPMVLKDTKHLTKLTVEGKENNLDIRPLHLIAHIKELTLSNCRIHVEAGVKISPIKLKLNDAPFFQDGVKLNSIRINDIVDFRELKELSLRSAGVFAYTEYLLDLRGSVTLEKLILHGIHIKVVNGEESQWAINHLAMMTNIPYSLNNKMNIKELYLSICPEEDTDFFNLSTSIQNIVVCHNYSPFKCSQPILLENLRHIQIVEYYADFSFLSLFMNCPQLTHLEFFQCNIVELKSLWMPKTIKTLTLMGYNCKIKWADGSYWKLEKIIVDYLKNAIELCKTKILVDDLIVYHSKLKVDESLVDFLELRKYNSIGKRLFIGELKWDDNPFEESGLFDHVEAKSSFYVFENGQKGRTVSKSAFMSLFQNILIQPRQPQVLV